MLVFHQSNCVGAIKRMLNFITVTYLSSILVFFHVFMWFLLLSFMRKSTALRVEREWVYWRKH